MKHKISAFFSILVLVLVLEYDAVSANICGSSFDVLVNLTSGNFSSPNYPRNYLDNTTKIWKIVAPVGWMIDLYFPVFFLERSSRCQFDYVKILDKCSDAVPMATYCGYTARPLRSRSNVLWVEFRSDKNQNRKGFEAIYTAQRANSNELVYCPRPSDNSSNINYCLTGGEVRCCNNDDSRCRVNQILTAKSGTITSPGYPGYYPHGIVFLWRITVPEGFVVQINFTTLITHHLPSCSNAAGNCTCDFVAAVDGPCSYNSFVRWCGAWTSQYKFPSFITTGRHMLLAFKSDDFNSEVGFSANYRRALKCSGDKPISCLKDSQPSCCIRDARTCSSQTSVRSHCPRDGDPSSYTICCIVNRYPTCCHNPSWSICASNLTTLNARSGNLSSPNYPNQYPNNATKIWKIIAPDDHVIDFYFEAFDLEERFDCDYDFVQIRNSCDDKNPIVRYCGNLARSVRSRGNVLWVEFRSDSTITKTGFSAFFVAVPKSSKPVSCPRPSDNQANIDYCLNGNDLACCNRNSPVCKYDILFTAPNGTFESPAYPNDYPPNTKFTWRITVPEGFLVQLNFTKLKIHSSDLCFSCNCDYVSVRDGPCMNVMERKWCHSYRENNLPSYTSSGRHLLVHFKSDSTFSLEGFQAKYRKALKCSGEAPYSCLQEGAPACCKEPERSGGKNTGNSIALKTETKILWFILITIASTLSRTLA